MMKVTVLYGHPETPDDFEKYYGSTHLPLAGKMKGVVRVKLTKFVAAPDGGKPSFIACLNSISRAKLRWRNHWDQLKGKPQLRTFKISQPVGLQC